MIVYRLWFNCVLPLVFNRTILLWVWLWLYMVMSLELTKQPPKLKFLLGHHLATNSFGLGRLFYKLLGAMTKMVATCRAAKENKT